MQNTTGSMDSQALVFPTANLSQPRIVYFISRTNGMLIPLVPADELPYNIRLQGLPRTLRFDQTYGMQHVGMLPYTGATFKLESENGMVRSTSQPHTPTHSRSRSSSPSQQFLPPDALARQAIANSAALGGTEVPQHALPQRPMSAHELATTHWRKTPTSTPAPGDKTQAVIDAIVGATQGADAVKSNNTVPPPSGHVPDQDKKEYCTYWIRTGECDYTQQGCLYKHEMPDPDALKVIGFRGTPRWWIEKNQKVRMGSAKPASSRVMDMPSWWPGESSTLTKPSSKDSNDGIDGSVSETGSDQSEPKEAEESTRKVTPPSIDLAPSATALSATNKVEPHVDSDETDDLIDFDVVTTPSTSPSASSEKATTTPAENGKTNPYKTPQTNTKNDSKAMTPRRVFVPAGESAEVHIAQVRKRNGRAQVPSSRTEAPSLQKQIQSLQKSKYGSLMASKHAVAVPGDSTSKEPQQLGRKRVPKRDRAIPIRSPGPVVVNLPGAEKSEK